MCSNTDSHAFPINLNGKLSIGSFFKHFGANNVSFARTIVMKLMGILVQYIC